MRRHWAVWMLGPIITGGALMLLGFSVVALIGGVRGTFDLNSARARWATRPFSHYRLDLRYGKLGYCSQSVEVVDDRVVAVLHNSCSTPAPTVDDLFNRIERDFHTVDGQCGPNGCACDGTIAVSALYDEQLGFPHSKLVELNQAARWRFLDYWKRRLAGQYCTSWDFGREIITVVALTPMV